MAILDVFKKEDGDKKEQAAPKTPAKKKEGKGTPSSTGNYGALLSRPYITEKASIASEQNVYTFEVTGKANKTELKKAIKALYNVTPIKINVITLPAKTVFSRGKAGVKSGKRKALVYLKKGDTIEFV